MKILLLTERFGGKIPTGVISLRLAEELRSFGNDVIVLSSNIDNYKWQNGIHFFSESINFLLPARIRIFISNILQINTSTLKWRNNMYNIAMKIVREYNPDVIYARATPISVCEVAAKLSKETGIPSLMHFTDPIPAPIEWDSNILYRRRMIKTMSRILPLANRVSFGNLAMMEYEQSLIKYNFMDKSFISTDPVPFASMVYTISPPKEELLFVYLGSLYGSRNPKPLFEALAALLRSGIKLRLNIYDINRVNTQIPSFVHFLGRVDNVRAALESADVLVDIDGDDSIPVFISSKIKEYLCCSRPILSISPVNSPTCSMTKSLKTVYNSTNCAEEIEKNIRSILSSNFNEFDYKEREEIIRSHTPNIVASKINVELNQMIK